MVNVLTPSDVDTWLNWAGKRLVAMPVARVKPAQPHVVWPAMVQELNNFEKLHHDSGSIRIDGPSKDEIPIVDAILTLPNRCNDVKIRRVLHARLLIHPVTDRHLFSWSKIAKLLAADRRLVKRWHETGLKETADKADERVVWLVMQYFGGAEP